MYLREEAREIVPQNVFAKKGERDVGPGSTFHFKKQYS